MYRQGALIIRASWFHLSLWNLHLSCSASYLQLIKMPLCINNINVCDCVQDGMGAGCPGAVETLPQSLQQACSLRRPRLKVGGNHARLSVKDIIIIFLSTENLKVASYSANVCYEKQIKDQNGWKRYVIYRATVGYTCFQPFISPCDSLWEVRVPMPVLWRNQRLTQLLRRSPHTPETSPFQSWCLWRRSVCTTPIQTIWNGMPLGDTL